MDYGKVLSRAWEITWRWKILWLLGFLAALGSAAGSGSSGSSSYTTDSSDWAGYQASTIPGEIWALVAGAVCLGIIFAIAIWVVSTIARGGLIAGVQQVEDEGSTSFGQAWRVGASRFWSLFGISVLAALPLLILAFVGVIALVVAIAGGISAADVSEGAVMGVVIPAVTCSCTLLCGMIIVGIILAQIRIYAERAAVLEGLGWIDAFGRGWQVLKDNLGPTIVFWLIFFVLGFVVVTVIGFVLFITLFPMSMIAISSDSGAWILASLCCLVPLAMVVSAVVGAIIETFSSATWTLAYREMTAMPAPAEPDDSDIGADPDEDSEDSTADEDDA
jgi:hypothetical protein